jgi:alanine racemase
MPPAQAGRALEAGLEVTVFTKEAAAVFSSVASTRRKRARLHLKVDTGMNRIGCRPDEAADLASYIHRLPATELASVYSHFATADDPDPTFARRQLELFLRVVSEVESRGIDVPLRHIANSAATLWLPESRLDLVRCGIALYGLLPRADRPLPDLSLEPALSIKARVTRISDIKKGDSTSYGRTWTADRDGRIATISLGYADGYPRSASGRGWAGFSGRRIPQRGSVCMDMCMFDATDAPELDTGSELVLMGPGGPSLEEVASWAGTINYEIACHAALRLPRVYIEGSR